MLCTAGLCLPAAVFICNTPGTGKARGTSISGTQNMAAAMMLLYFQIWGEPVPLDKGGSVGIEDEPVSLKRNEKIIWKDSEQ